MGREWLFRRQGAIDAWDTPLPGGLRVVSGDARIYALSLIQINSGTWNVINLFLNSADETFHFSVLIN